MNEIPAGRGAKRPTSRGLDRSWAWLGYLAILVGLTLHKWALERILAPDEHIASTAFSALIALFQLGWIGLGIVLLWQRPRLRLGAVATWTAGTILTGLLLFGLYANLRALGILDPYREVKSAWDEVTAAEELLLALTLELRRLDESVLNLALPDLRSRRLFSTEVSVRDLPETAVEELQLPAVSVTVRERQAVDGELRVATADLRLWRPLLDRVDYFQHAGFKFVAGRFLDADHDHYETELHFAGLARTETGRWSSIDVDQTVRWRREGPEANPPATAWRIAGWRTERWTVQEADELLFAEVLDRAVADPEDLRRARRSLHEERVRELFLDPEKVTASLPYFRPRSVDFHPGVSVVDLDRDGFDDLYVMVRWGPNLFFRNRGDGTFEEIASELGLDIRDHTAGAVFADFDNDGDADALLARTLDRSLYLVNEDGRFVDRSADLVDGTLPCLASSVSAVDYDADGLLDVYISTYGLALTPYLVQPDPEGLMRKCLSEADRQAWIRKISEEGRAVWNTFGPPNVMLRNRGDGRFETVRLMPDLFRNSYQSTWSDYDGDGDPDVYLANDFAPNNLLRNDGGGRFTDVTGETGTADLGFGMGASWGDYDNDGRHDLYVSNMFSKAGRRITSRVPDVDPRLQAMSQGNSLFHNTGGRFRKVSGTTPDTLQVEKAGWSWGGQLADFDNDGFVDVYALSGFFTSPAPFDLPVDL